MTHFRERNLPLVGAITILVVLVLIVGALEFAKLPLVNSTHSYKAEFASAGGLVAGDVVTVDGVKVGTITNLALKRSAHRATVEVTFTADPSAKLGSATSAAAKVLSPIGTEYLELTPAGTGPLATTIPVERTTLPYNLVADLSQLGAQIQQYNIPQLQKALQTGADSLSATAPAEVSSAFNGLARLSQVLGNDQADLSAIVSQGAGLSQVLSDRSGQLVDLVSQSNVVLQVLAQRKAAIDTLLTSTSALTAQITEILDKNRVQLGSLLTSLQTVSGVLAKDSSNIAQAIPLLAAFGRYAANTTGSGAFADVAVPTLLLPDNVLAQCAAAGAFPSTDPQVGCRP